MRSLTGIGFLLTAVACSKAPADVNEAAKEAGCNVVGSSDTTPDIFNSSSVKCSDGARVYWFPTEEANKNHGEMCKQVGGKKVASGKNWTKYSPSC
jgi:hypothetical protein